MSDRHGPAIRCQSLGKRFAPQGGDPYRGLRQRLHQAVQPRRAGRSAKAEPVWALRDVNLDIPWGQILGILGANGSGKSVFLRILARVTKPTTGRSDVYGSVNSILNLGSMLHPELTGRQNLYQIGTLLRLRRSTIDARFDDIVDFSGIAPHLDALVRTYSAGMQLRLAFAVVAHLESDVLLIDEALAVSDQEFRGRCVDRIRQMAREGRTIAVVSHELPLITDLCDAALIFEAGRVVAQGNARAVVAEYSSGPRLAARA